MKIERPLTYTEITKLLGENNRLIVDVDVDLGDILDNNLEGFNDLIQERINDSYAAMLGDISYQVVGHISPPEDTYIGGTITIRVDCEVEFPE